ncbi:GNAT family N-acetyltransferase [Sporolactobacillus sp. CPB3-1]|uniref:GNAT family N-acetyltransferase n=1 Tax=Sporolactobacillus mangiferae TaxID=2940498 RepID=A0ABT0ME08_9BACL|nr:GNAT family N-acetyltransferase [Sporolactobacillus mangiferae]MCL1632833.1 GNAT family N-acetyltransferase [Sporolactobacillus mangiferae]
MDDHKLVIREAKKSDAFAIIDYLNQIAGETDFLTFGSIDELNLTVEKEEKLVEDFAARENAIYLIALYDGQIVGSLNFAGGRKRRTMHVGEFGISVRQDYWNKGIGRALIARMIEWSKATGIIRKINLRVRSDNMRALHLYKSFGFSEEGMITRDFLIHNTFYDSVQMGLFID